MKHKLINGWTKDKMKAYIVKYNKNCPAVTLVNEVASCVYKTEDGNRCAVGVFIPDSFEEAFKFDSDVTQLLIEFPKLKKYMPLELKGLREMQAIHDDPKNSSTHRSLFEYIDECVT